MQFYLEELLGRPVDLVKALRVEFRPYVEREVINVKELKGHE